MIRRLVLAFLVLLSAGCVVKRHPQHQTAPICPSGQPEEPRTSPLPPMPPPENGVVPSPPEFKTLNWAAGVRPLVEQLLAAEKVPTGAVLLIDSVKNNTNGTLYMKSAEEWLQRLLGNSEKFALINPSRVLQAKAMLGLSQEDNLITRAKAMGLAHYLNAQYLLYSYIDGDVKSPVLKVQLLLVSSGEIIWFGQNLIPH